MERMNHNNPIEKWADFCPVESGLSDDEPTAHPPTDTLDELLATPFEANNDLVEECSGTGVSAASSSNHSLTLPVTLSQTSLQILTPRPELPPIQRSVLDPVPKSINVGDGASVAYVRELESMVSLLNGQLEVVRR